MTETEIQGKAPASSGILGSFTVGSGCPKSGDMALLNGPQSHQKVVCTECGSENLWRDGIRWNPEKTEKAQRYLCRQCGLRFSEKPLNNQSSIQLTAKYALGEAKNLEPFADNKLREDGQKRASVEPQIVNYLVKLKNNGRHDTTIEARDWQLKRLVSLGADLNDPESVKKAVASLNRSESYKVLLCVAYEGFLEANGKTWQRPEYKQSENIPFVPHESELDSLIAGCNRKTAAFLKLLKETAMRPGEAWLSEWTDFDSINRTFVCNHPEKNSKKRAFDNLSPDLCRMLADLPHNSQFMFTTMRQPLEAKEDQKTHFKLLKRQKSILTKQRMRVANKLKNPRIAEISYCTCRHWKATELYHKTKDILYVMKFLGHRSIKNTLVYIDTERISYPHGGDDYTGKVATTQTEKLQLIEAGFEKVGVDPDGTWYFRKRK